MSSSKAYGHTKSREAPRVYRCGDSHWHFLPRKHNHTSLNPPWYEERKMTVSPSPLQRQPRRLGIKDALKPLQQDEGKKFPSGFGPVYLQGYGNEEFTADEGYVSGFYGLYPSRTSTHWCQVKKARSIYREEELSETPWPSDTPKAPPAYEATSSEPPGYARDTWRDSDVGAGPSKT